MFRYQEKIANRKAEGHRRKYLAGCARLAILWILSFSCVFGAEQEWSGFPLPPSKRPVAIERFHYDMRGSVRLLFFWIGKSGVGGGWVSRIRSSGDQTAPWFEGWEVLFGSKPEAVPGGHNRWGYARELAFWKQGEDGSSGPILTKTVFEGFMTKSSEDSLSEVRKGEGTGAGGTAFEGTVSSVHPDHASVEIRRFNSDAPASFESPAGIARQYLNLLKAAPPDEARTLTHPSPSIRPVGFLTAVSGCLSDVIRAGNNKEAWKQLKKQERSYDYNARDYSLEITKIKHHDEVDLAENLSVRDVFEIEFETGRIGESGGHDFAVWTAATGKFAGIPLKIVDKPRWWLKVELTLIDSSSTSSFQALASTSMPNTATSLPVCGSLIGTSAEIQSPQRSASHNHSSARIGRWITVLPAISGGFDHVRGQHCVRRLHRESAPCSYSEIGVSYAGIGKK